MNLPHRLQPYLRGLAERTELSLGARLVGIYAGGSVALGAYEHGRSDVDIAVIVDGATTHDCEATADAVRHESFACPARGLELVVYTIEAARSGSTDPGILLNLNTGAAITYRLDREADPTESHWFAIDRSILAEHAIAITGPPAEDVFAPVPFEDLLPLFLASLEWHYRRLGRPDDAVLNAARTLRYVVEREWSPKRAAGFWMCDHFAGSDLPLRAINARGATDSEIAWDEVDAFVAQAAKYVHAVQQHKCRGVE